MVPMTPEVHIAGLAAALEPGLWWIGGTALLVALAFAGALAWRATDVGRMRAVRRGVEDLDMPAAASTVGGRILCANVPLRAACGEEEAHLAPTLERGFDVTPATIYRLATTARRLGFGFEQTRTRADSETLFLTARLSEPDIIVWTVVPPERMPRSAPDSQPDLGDATAWPQLRIGPDDGPAANAAFRARYGEPEDLPDLTAPDDAADGRRVLLTRQDGATELCGLWAFPASGQEGDARDVLVLPLHAGDEPSGARAALEVMPVALMQFDPSGRLLWSNAHAREIVGKALEPGEALADLVEPLGRPLEALLSETASRMSSRREMVRLRDGGEDTFLHIALTPVTLDGTPCLLAVLSDASELRHLEDKFAQSQKMEAVGKLAGGVAHDFNNVLTAISGHADLLLMGKDALHPDYSDLMQIRQNANRAAALVRQLLAFSRKQTLKPQLLSIADVVSDTQYLLNRLIGEKVSLTVEHGPDIWQVQADQQQLEQALMNLVVNARDAMPEGGSIILATRNVLLEEPRERQNVEIPDGAYVEISVSDTGSGIPPHVIDRIFEPFFTTKARGEGTGLGLSTVYGIVKQSGGYIFAENRAEGGACFRILLPRAQAEDVPRTGDIAPPPERHDLTGKGVVLLVEDEDPVRSFASRALRLRGYEVLEAASAEAGMDLLTDPANHVDVLVTDVVMPGMDGPTFAAEARRMRPDLRVVFVSGYAEDSFRRTLMDRDFLFLPKPFSLTDLTAKVKEALGQPA